MDSYHKIRDKDMPSVVFTIKVIQLEKYCINIIHRISSTNNVTYYNAHYVSQFTKPLLMQIRFSTDDNITFKFT